MNERLISIYEKEYVAKIVDIPSIGRRGICTDIVIKDNEPYGVVLWDTDVAFEDVPYDNDDNSVNDLSVKSSVIVLKLTTLRKYIQ